jgi:hypothetical protein
VITRVSPRLESSGSKQNQPRMDAKWNRDSLRVYSCLFVVRIPRGQQNEPPVDIHRRSEPSGRETRRILFVVRIAPIRGSSDDFGADAVSGENFQKERVRNPSINQVHL